MFVLIFYTEHLWEHLLLLFFLILPASIWEYKWQTGQLFLGIVASLFSIYISKHPPYLRFLFPLSRLLFHSELLADFINMLPITFSRWLMGLKTGPNSNQCFYSGPFCRIICFMVKVSFYYFFVVFGNPFSPLPCSKLSNSTLIQFIGVNSTCREEETVHININTLLKSFIISM